MNDDMKLEFIYSCFGNCVIDEWMGLFERAMEFIYNIIKEHYNSV